MSSDNNKNNPLKIAFYNRKFLSIIFIAVIIFVPSRIFGQNLTGTSHDFTTTCLNCHSNENMTMTFPSGEVISLYVNEDTYNSSVHGQMGFSCAKCHESIVGFPHDVPEVESYREFSLALYPVCTTCHKDQIMEIQGNVHMTALAEGNPNAAICTDCHGNHNIQQPDEPGGISPRTCQRCHSQIFYLYEESVHGAALISEGNPDVPSCTDCHGSHKMLGPNNSPFHLFSPSICARCHGDQELMSRYGISTDVLDTYITDFHGTTVTMFQQVAPDQETNKPVCIDCHGVHDILPPTDPNSHVMKENLLDTCQKCHPNATTNFPDAWMSHFKPRPDKYKFVYYVSMFYKFLIPLVIGGMLVFVVTDIIRTVMDRKKPDNG